MSDKVLTEIARNVLAAFLLTLGIVPSEDEEVLEVRDHGRHRVYSLMAQLPAPLADTIDPADVLDQLVAYVEYHNARPGAVRFHPYNAEVYICPCGCGTFLYVSIYHDA